MDELERRLRRARPASGNRHMPLTDRAERDLATMLAANSPVGATPHLSSEGRWFGACRVLAAAAAVLLVTVAGVVAVTSTPAPSYAATPPLLSFRPIDQGAGEMLTQLSALAGTADDVPASRGEDVTIRVHTWTLSVTASSADSEVHSTVVPEHYTITRGGDGSHRIVVRAGSPMTGGRVEPGVPTGPITWQEEWPAGSHVPLFGDSVPEDPSGIGAHLEGGAGLVEPIDASAYFQALVSLLLEQRPGPQQRSALLAFLAALPDVELVGSTTDRLGRDGVAFRAERGDEYVELLVVSPSDGQVLSAETLYVGDSRTDIPSPSVISYYAWEWN